MKINPQTQPRPFLDVDLQFGPGIAEADPDIPTAQAMGGWMSAALQLLDYRGECVITVRVVDEAEMKALNKAYRQKIGVTNILSFPFSAPDGLDLAMEAPLEPALLGDLVVCLSVVQREAREQHKPLMHHWAHLLLHGTLHLLGFDHIDPVEAEVMETHEREILRLFGIPDPYLPDIPDPYGENETQ
jgi:probable rRNA maturation factor